MAPFHARTSQFLKERNSQKQLNEKISAKHSILIHCSSLGEFEMISPILPQLQKLGKPVVISFYSDSGYNNADLSTYPNIKKLYFPFDKPKKVRSFFERINPSLVIFVAYEYWFNSLKYLYQKNIPYLFINVRFRKKTWFFNPIFKSFEKLIKEATYISVRDKDDRSKLLERNYKNVGFQKDLRYVQAGVNAQFKFTGIPLQTNRLCVIYGSTWPEDERIIEPFVKNHSEILHVIAPHDVSTENISRIENIFKDQHTITYSQLVNTEMHNVIIIDSIGQLKYLYKYGNLCYVGGGFSNGLHNIIEPLVFKKNVIIGPNYGNDPEAENLINDKIVYSISNYSELASTFNVLKDKDFKVFPNDYHYDFENEIELLINKIESIIVGK